MLDPHDLFDQPVEPGTFMFIEFMSLEYISLVACLIFSAMAFCVSIFSLHSSLTTRQFLESIRNYILGKDIGRKK